MRRLTRMRVPIVAALVLLGLAAGALGAFVHTDDGCDVEQHCRACRVAVAGLAASLPASVQAPAPAAVGDAHAPEAVRAPFYVALSSDSNRGPPAAA